MHRRSSSPSRGASLLESLIAIGLLTMILPGLVIMTNSSSKVQRSSLLMENAVAVGQAVLDSLSLVPASLLPTGGSIDRSGEWAGRTYQVTWWYTPSFVGAPHGSIQTDVKWTQAGKEHSVRLVGGAR